MAWEGPEVDMVRNAYKRALEAVRSTPIDMRVILGKSSFPSGGVGFLACAEHRVIREEAG